MSFKQKQQKTFIKYKEGKFYRTTDKELQEPLGDFVGKVIDIGLKMENIPGNPVPVEKLFLDLDGGNGDIYGLSLSFESSLASKLIGFLASVDLSQTITLSPAYKVEGEKIIRTIFVKQGASDDGPSAKNAFNKDSDRKAPQMKQLKNKKWAKEEFNDFYRDVVLNELKPSLGGTKSTKTELVEVAADVEDDSENNQGLPF